MDSVQVKLSGMELRRPRPFGNCWLACELWQQLGLDRVLANANCRGAVKAWRGRRCCGCWW